MLRVFLCRPYHSCVPLQDDAKLALEELYSIINNQLKTQPEGIENVAGDFHHVEMKAVPSKFHMHINVRIRQYNCQPGSYYHLGCV